MVNAKQITELQKQRKIKKLVWDMICSATKLDINPYATEEYTKLTNLGWNFFPYKQDHREWVSRMKQDERIMFTLFIYHSLP
jgi:hypothetical protein